MCHDARVSNSRPADGVDEIVIKPVSWSASVHNTAHGLLLYQMLVYMESIYSQPVSLTTWTTRQHLQLIINAS